jgi:hypothetical protein
MGLAVAGWGLLTRKTRQPHVLVLGHRQFSSTAFFEHLGYFLSTSGGCLCLLSLF